MESGLPVVDWLVGWLDSTGWFGLRMVMVEHLAYGCVVSKARINIVTHSRKVWRRDSWIVCVQGKIKYFLSPLILAQFKLLLKYFYGNK